MRVLETIPTLDAKPLADREENARRWADSGTEKQKAEAECVLLAISSERGEGSIRPMSSGNAWLFGTPMPEHDIRMQWEPKGVQIHLGRLGGINPISPTYAAMEEWGNGYVGPNRF
jgi:hypothetical protein